MNTVPATVDSAGAPATFRTHGGAPFRAAMSVPASDVGGTVTLGVRPEDLTVTDGPGLFTGEITLVEKLGEVTLLYVEAGHTEPIVAKVDGDAAFVRGETVSLTAPMDRLHVFDGSGRAYQRLEAAQAA